MDYSPQQKGHSAANQIGDVMGILYLHQSTNRGFIDFSEWISLKKCAIVSSATTGMETLDNVWGLFETATRLNSRKQRVELFKLAGELAECQNLPDWIERTPVLSDHG